MSRFSASRKLDWFVTIWFLMLVTVASAQQTQHWAVAFHQNSLPANVDRVVANAGGTITVRLPEIGGIGVDSTDPNFGAKMSKDSSVKAVDIATVTTLIDPTEPGLTSADNNGGTSSPTGPDTQPMPDPL